MKHKNTIMAWLCTILAGVFVWHEWWAAVNGNAMAILWGLLSLLSCWLAEKYLFSTK